MATKERVEHSVQNIMWNYILIIIGSIMPFIIRTLIIRFWGMDYLGLNSLFSSILQALNISELGIGSALVFNMYKPAAEKNDKQVNMLLSLYNYIYKTIGLGILSIGIIIIPFLPRLISGSYPSDINISVVYILFLLQVVLSYLIEAYCSAAFQANQISYITSKCAVIGWILIYLVQVIALLFARNFYQYAICLPFASIIIYGLQFLYFKKIFPQYKVGRIEKRDLGYEFWKDFKQRIFAMSLSKIRMATRGSVDILIISMTLGLVAVAKYQNYLLVMSVPVMLITGLLNGILPSLGNAMAKETKESNLAVVELVSFIIHWVGVIFTSFLICFYQPFMKIWAGDTNLLSFVSVVLFSIYFYLRCVTEISQLARNGSGVWWAGKWVAIAETVANIILNVVFVQVWGIEGVIFATIISIAVINIPFETYYVFKECFGINAGSVLVSYLKEFLVATAVVIVTYAITRMYNSTWIKTFIVWGGTCVVVPNMLLAFIYRNNEKFKEIVNIIVVYYNNRRHM